MPYNRITNPKRLPVGMINGYTDGIEIIQDCGEK
jgi:hypothetical protein